MKYLYKGTPVLILILVISTQSVSAQEDSQVLPAVFESNRIFVQPITQKGDTLKLYTDSGGGLILSKRVTQRLGLSIDTVKAGSKKLIATTFPEFKPDATIPGPPAQATSSDAQSMHKKYQMLGRRLSVQSMPSHLQPIIEEGILGQKWFSTRIWTFDYPNKQLVLHNDVPSSIQNQSHQVPVYFKHDQSGKHLMHFPRIQATVDGDTLNFLLDTGATIALSDSAQQSIELDLPKMFGGSFIIRSKFEQWHQEHPGWKVINNAGRMIQSDLIRVPEVSIAGYTVGPVWFLTRPDSKFKKKMARWMDQPTEGALGGSLFKYFSITVNYPDGYAVFERAGRD